ncbi:MAG: tRNA (adenine-N1)-methyltransferase [Deltaproteobacteria bacterium]|nr:tRNA (adenine-N1)-methyltransferase [Deltaproteobacteria bacterium]
MDRFQMGESVMLTSQKGKKWLVRIDDTPFSCHLGAIHMKDVLGREEGEHLETHKGAKLFLFRPSLEDYIFTMVRKTQIIYPKDLGAIVFHGDIRHDDLIIESGIGSGALSMALLRALGENGTLISVEKRPEFALQASENIAKFFGRAPSNHQVIVADIQDFSLNALADRVFLDLPEPWHAIGPVAGLLRQGGLLLSLSPNIGQVQLVYRELKAHGFAAMNTFELMKRDWMVDERRARPKDRMIAHTGFITVAKKTPFPMASGDPEE